MASTTSVTDFKCLLVGDARAGKTAFIARHLGQQVPVEYNATLGVNVNSISFKTTTGSIIRFNVWDCAGNPQFAGLGNGYYTGADCAIVAFDASDPNARVSWWSAQLPKIPTVIMGTHSDMVHTKSAPGYEAACPILVNSMVGPACIAPFAELARRLAHVEIADASAKLTVDIDALMPTYTLIPFITTAIIELRTNAAHLLDLSGMKKTDPGCSASLACSPELIVPEFASAYGLEVDRNVIACDGHYAIRYILQAIEKSARPLRPAVTQEFIKTVDRALFEFIIARINLIKSTFRSAEPIYRKVIEDIAAQARAAAK